MDKLAEIIDKQFTELAKAFRPVFGNSQHIQIAQQMSELSRLEKMIKQKQLAAKGAKILQEEYTRLKRNTLYLLKR